MGFITRARLPRATVARLPAGMSRDLIPGHYANFSGVVASTPWTVDAVNAAAPFAAAGAGVGAVSNINTAADFSGVGTFSPVPPPSQSFVAAFLFKPRSYAIAKTVQDHALTSIL